MYHSGKVISTAILVLAICAIFDVPSTIQYPILHWPVAVMVLALAVGLASWWWLGRPAWFRRHCSRPWIGFFDPWDRTQVHRYRDLYATRFTKNTPGLDRFFRGVIGRRRPADLDRYIWGALYTTCALAAPQWRGLLSILLMAVVWAAYVPAAAPVIIGVVSLVMTGFAQPPLCTPLLVAGGRKERLFATVSLILVLSTVSVLLIAALVGLTHLLAPLVPAVTWKGRTWQPQAIGFQTLAVPLLVLPLVSLMQILFYRKPAWLALSTMFVLAIMMMSSMWLGSRPIVTPTVVIGSTVLTWGICVSTLYWIAMRRDLMRR